MKRSTFVIIFLALLIVVISVYFLITKTSSPNLDSPNEISVALDPTSINQTDADNSIAPKTTSENQLAQPTQEFKDRITLKPFGIYITPENSPVQPERFAGYHTGIDVEFTDTDEEIPVFAISNGTVLTAQFVNGYGGLVVLGIEHKNRDINVIYGHLDPTRLPAKGTTVTTGEILGYLGIGNTFQTDYERKHLHFGMYKNDSIDLRGYVATSAELAAWHDPSIFF